MATNPDQLYYDNDLLEGQADLYTREVVYYTRAWLDACRRELSEKSDLDVLDLGAGSCTTSFMLSKEPYVGRMRKLGKDMYSLIGIPKGDPAANWAQWGRNYKFFDAPVGLLFTIDKELDAMSFVDVGMFMQTFMLAAKVSHSIVPWKSSHIKKPPRSR